MTEKEGEADVREKGTTVDLEELLAREVGLGRHQVKVQVLCALTAMLSSLSTSEYVFTTGRTHTRCLIPECESMAHGTEFSPSWLGTAVPSEGQGFDGCHRFASTNTSDFLADSDSCPVNLFNRNVTVNCEKYVYEKTNSIVYSMDLGCDEWRRSLVGSARTLGALLSLPTSGALSDRWGRRTALAIVSFNAAWMGALRYFANTYTGFIISVFVEATLGAGAILSCSYILAVEDIPLKYRITAGTISNTFFSTGQVLLALLAWAFPYWRHLTLVIYLPQLLLLSYFWILPESIRWYLSKSRYEDAEEALKKMARTNGKELSEKTLTELRQTAENEKEKTAKKNENQPWLIMEVFRHKPVLVRCMVTPVWWITLTLIYYGMSINAVNISGNPYLNYVAVSVVDIPGFWSAMFLVERVGRKRVLMAAYWSCAACQIAYIFIPTNIYAASLAVYLIGKYSISMSATVVYLYTSELFPTEYRHTLFGYSSMMGRIGSIVAPLTPALGAMIWKQLPFVVFASMALVSGVLTLLTPETKGCKLPDSMKEAADLGRTSTEKL